MSLVYMDKVLAADLERLRDRRRHGAHVGAAQGVHTLRLPGASIILIIIIIIMIIVIMIMIMIITTI